MKLIDGEVIPGVGIGNILLNMSKDEVLAIIGDDYEEKVYANGSCRICIENATFDFTDNKLIQIGVSQGFCGKYKGQIGIGSTMTDVRRCFGDYECYSVTFGIYTVKDVDGLCFELEYKDEYDEDEEKYDDEFWESYELIRPIEHMYVNIYSYA